MNSVIVVIMLPLIYKYSFLVHLTEVEFHHFNIRFLLE